MKNPFFLLIYALLYCHFISIFDHQYIDIFVSVYINLCISLCIELLPYGISFLALVWFFVLVYKVFVSVYILQISHDVKTHKRSSIA